MNNQLYQQQKNKFLFLGLLFLGFLPLPVKASLNTYSADFESGSSQYLSIIDASQTGLDLTDDFTLEAWFKIESSFADEDNRKLISKYDNSGNQRGYAWSLYKPTGANHKFELNLSSDCSTGVAQTSSSFSSPLSTGIWYHSAVSYDASAGSVLFYLNGSQIGSAVTGFPNSVCNNTDAFSIGRYNAVGGIHYWDGLIDDVRVWSDIRTSNEILTNSTTQDFDTTNLVAYWQLNNEILDQTANNNDLTNNNSVIFSTSTPFAGTAPAGGGGSSSTSSTLSFTDTEIIDDFINRYGRTLFTLMAGAVFALFVYLVYNFYIEYKKWYNNI